jgi:ribosomal protein S10
VIAAQEHASGQAAMIVTGISEETDRKALFKWSAGRISSVVDVRSRIIRGSLEYSDLPEVNASLSRQRVGGVFARASYFNCPDACTSDSTVGIREETSDRLLSVVMKEGAGGRETFFIAEFSFSETMHDERGIKYHDVMNLLPLMVPVKYACGQYCWHSPGLFANLTIDDPFLVEPYGNLSYAGLLGEMKKYGFHTTIAFIPWNFDRSKEEAVEIIKNNPINYSISIHGSDHDRNEFQKAGEIGRNEAKIARALARMELFTKNTGIAYDRVMIYPRDIGPADTVNMLKRHNFLGTANWRNIPSDVRVDESDVIHSLREAVFDVGGIPSLKRYNPLAVSDFRVAMTLFSGMPLLYSCHQHDFEGSIEWFNRTASKVNGFCPAMKWVGLGEIFRNLYLKKKRDDQSWEIRMYSRNIKIENKEDVTLKYHVTKPDDMTIPIRSVSVNGIELPYMMANKELTFALSLPPHGSGEILIEYRNEQTVGDVDVSRQGIYQETVRWLSEFRDLELSKTGGGRLLIRIIYSNVETKAYLVYVAAILCGLVAICLWIKRGEDPS